ncbi:hypothetical protein GCM10009645_49650 [Mycolicibacterium poriferae]|uniref:Transposase IS4-like domain-containing protein n=1 Tax=Mycolicibacterium poriferae TaxID=39694 RepID=A0A6N4V9Z9_9MYCO|nr:hypothetical protein MPOR_19560 [Mycolicibacterium poriferae]
MTGSSATRTGCSVICPDQEIGARAAEAVALLALIAGQDVEPVEGSDGTDGQWRIAQRVAPDRVISTVDPDTRHAHKSVHRRQDGFKAHVAVEPDTGIITECALRQATGAQASEASVAAELLDNENGPVAVLADSAYGSGDSARIWWPTVTLTSSSPHRCVRRWPQGSPRTTSSSIMPTRG